MLFRSSLNRSSLSFGPLYSIARVRGTRMQGRFSMIKRTILTAACSILGLVSASGSATADWVAAVNRAAPMTNSAQNACQPWQEERGRRFNFVLIVTILRGKLPSSKRWRRLSLGFVAASRR